MTDDDNNIINIAFKVHFRFLNTIAVSTGKVEIKTSIEQRTA